MRAYQQCAVLMHACTQLLARHPHPSAQTVRQLKLAHLLAASAALETHKQHPEDSASLRWALKMLEDGRAMAAAMNAAVAGSSSAAAAAAGTGAGAVGGMVAAGAIAETGAAAKALGHTGSAGPGAGAGAGAAVKALLQTGSVGGGDLSDVCECLTAFSIGTRLKEKAVQADVLERCEGLSAFTAEHALKLVALCNGHDQYR